VWTLGSWCRLRADFRTFRPDRIVAFEPTGETFVETPERGMAAYVRAMGGDSEGLDI
jgi:predicted DNA-binding transcriptional regulator YafY